ncbi:DUF4382 domain-containing protein [Chloroflexota bacterium]
MRKSGIVSIIAIVLLLLALSSLGCGTAVGTLQFMANGEDFVRQGFESKDGWDISFDYIYVTLSEIKAYQTDPPYDSHDDGAIVDAKVTMTLFGTHTVDLAAGDADADPILVGQVSDATTGQYNAVSWKMIKATSGDASGYSLVAIGTATKDTDTVDFTIKVETEYAYYGGEFVGDVRKGVLTDGATADLEMTFHFDHIFGDAETAADDELNTAAPGFQPFADLAVDDVLDMNMTQIETGMESGAYNKLLDMLPTLGHVGEGHCHCDVINGD